MKNLSGLEPGGKAVVVDVADTEISRRLQDIGLTRGTHVTCLRRSPLGDPAAYRIRGAVIALRAEDSAHVWVRQG